MKPFFTVQVTGITSDDSGVQTFEIDRDLRTVIPIQLRGKKFVLYSALSIIVSVVAEGLPDNNPHAISVSADLPHVYSSAKHWLRLGIARPLVYDESLYGYTRGECCPHVIDYPEVNSLQYALATINSDVKISSGCSYTLDLWFELLE